MNLKHILKRDIYAIYISLQAALADLFRILFFGFSQNMQYAEAQTIKSSTDLGFLNLIVVEILFVAAFNGSK